MDYERPASLDEAGHRIAMHPASVKGKWKTRRVYFQSVLFFVLLLLPWVRINGYPSVLIDLPQRRFALFGLTFWAHDAPLLFLVLGTFAFSAALLTAIFGRVWCGWACPQTVFVERVFRTIEIWIEGSHLSRRKLALEPWTLRKFRLRAAKWILFSAISLVITHSLLAYFVGVDRLSEMIQAPPRESWDVFLVMISVTAVLLFNFGWFREQFCIIMCPYGKIQSLLTDEKTLSVAYDQKRGEPRRKGGGDCVDCSRCVSVCPTGIDIRRGTQQLECINCTACIDACDDVMKKVKRPQGLIRYASDRELASGQKERRFRVKSVRVLLYGTLLLFCVISLAWTVSHRRDLRVVALRAIEIPYQVVKDESGNNQVINHFKVDMQNQTLDSYSIELEQSKDDRVQFVMAIPSFDLPGGKRQRFDVFVKFAAGQSIRSARINFVARNKRKQFGESAEVVLVAPEDMRN